MVEPVEAPLGMLKRDARGPEQVVDDVTLHDDEEFSGIRCPLCRWQPTASSTWCCERTASPEPFFIGCGTVWNTFTTQGVCPGCRHRWLWTSCLRCGGWSLHEDWYERPDRPRA
jgi:hypothetical protein